LSSALGKEVVMIVTEFVPGVGPVVAKAVSLEEAARDVREYRRSWKAAIAELGALSSPAPQPQENSHGE
jgi:hypothetical protein